MLEMEGKEAFYARCKCKSVPLWKAVQRFLRLKHRTTRTRVSHSWSYARRHLLVHPCLLLITIARRWKQPRSNKYGKWGMHTQWDVMLIKKYVPCEMVVLWNKALSAKNWHSTFDLWLKWKEDPDYPKLSLYLHTQCASISEKVARFRSLTHC